MDGDGSISHVYVCKDIQLKLFLYTHGPVHCVSNLIIAQQDVTLNLIVAPCIFCGITSIYQPTNAHIISHKTLQNIPTCFDVVRSSSGSLVPCWSYITVFTIQLVFANELLWQHIMLCRNVLWSSGQVCFVRTRYAASTPRLQIPIKLWVL